MIFHALFPFLLLVAPSAAASELLVFRDQAKGIREQQVIKELTAEKYLDAAQPLSIAPFDLNGDGVEEWIIRQNPSPACAAESACRFIITGLQDRKPVVLAALEGGKVGISSEKLYGVRKLLVYNKKNDDFTFSVYVWTPHLGRFEAE